MQIQVQYIERRVDRETTINTRDGHAQTKIAVNKQTYKKLSERELEKFIKIQKQKRQDSVERNIFCQTSLDWCNGFH